MPQRMEEIEARIAQIEKRRQIIDMRERRLLDATAAFYAEQEKAEIAGLAPLLAQAGREYVDLEGFFRAQEAEARQRIEAVTPLLQLTEEEIAFINREKRALVLINPCALVPPHSPGWECVFLAASCGSSDWSTTNATSSCTCAAASHHNEFNARAEADGQGATGLRYATTQCWFYFDIPARPGPANVTVQVLMYVHGFYVVRSATGSAAVRLEVKAEGWQYGYSWSSAKSQTLDVSGDTMGRHDGYEFLEFLMPVGADPFLVRVSASLQARAKGGGALAAGDFATRASNYIEVAYVNTLS